MPAEYKKDICVLERIKFCEKVKRNKKDIILFPNSLVDLKKKKDSGRPFNVIYLIRIVLLLYLARVFKAK